MSEEQDAASIIERQRAPLVQRISELRTEVLEIWKRLRRTVKEEDVSLHANPVDLENDDEWTDPQDVVLVVDAQGVRRVALSSRYLDLRPLDEDGIDFPIIEFSYSQDLTDLLTRAGADMVEDRVRQAIRELGKKGKEIFSSFGQEAFEGWKQSLERIVTRLIGKFTDERRWALTYEQGLISSAYKSFLERAQEVLARDIGRKSKMIVAEAIDHAEQQLMTGLVPVLHVRGGPQEIASSPILPPNTLYCAAGNNRTTLVVVQQPRQQTIWINATLAEYMNISVSERKKRYDEERDGYTFRVSLPWLFFVFYFENQKMIDNVEIFAAQAAIATGTEPLYYLPFPNQYDTGKFCFYLGEEKVESDGLGVFSVSQRVMDVIQNFWGSEFNQDLTERWESYEAVNPILWNYLEWEKASVADPQYALKCSMAPGRFTEFNLLVSHLTRWVAGGEADPYEEVVRGAFRRLEKDLNNYLLPYFSSGITMPDAISPPETESLLRTAFAAAAQGVMEEVKEALSGQAESLLPNANHLGEKVSEFLVYNSTEKLDELLRSLPGTEQLSIRRLLEAAVE